ncbi:hypothetical protein ACFX13_037083 [Malus domestica]
MVRCCSVAGTGALYGGPTVKRVGVVASAGGAWGTETEVTGWGWCRVLGSSGHVGDTEVVGSMGGDMTATKMCT